MIYIAFKNSEEKLKSLHAWDSDVAVDWREIHVIMMQYVSKLNPSYVVRFTRVWQSEGNTLTIDFGSHVEFFKVIGDLSQIKNSPLEQQKEG